MAGFPNLFFMVGPNSGPRHGSTTRRIEAQARHVVAQLRLMRRLGARTVEVRREVQRSFSDWIDGRMADTVWQTGGCRSGYQDPRSGRNTGLWPGTVVAFRRRTRRIRAEDHLMRRA
ncbi:hypothetical protein [Streptomyces pseudogriseolus]|uniref:hypothetical protein n=1 Tax=Streptomyces pseudogriseolus TaxID=36817 RepID=UPI003FA1B5A8